MDERRAKVDSETEKEVTPYPPLASISYEPTGLVFVQCMTESVRQRIMKSVHYAYRPVECVTSYLTSVQSGWSVAYVTYVHCMCRRSQTCISYVNSCHCSHAVNQWSVVGISDAVAAAERSQLRAS